MNLYLQCLPGEIVIRESSPEPGDSGTDCVVATVTAEELLEMIEDHRRRKLPMPMIPFHSDADNAKFWADFEADYDRRRELANRPVGGNKHKGGRDMNGRETVNLSEDPERIGNAINKLLEPIRRTIVTPANVTIVIRGTAGDGAALIGDDDIDDVIDALEWLKANGRQYSR